MGETTLTWAEKAKLAAEAKPPEQPAEAAKEAPKEEPKPAAPKPQFLPHDEKALEAARADPKRYVVLDAGALIKLQRADTLGDVLIAPAAVLKEVKDARARSNMGMLPTEIVTRTPHPRAVQFVREFAKKTGDLGFLSVADIDVAALTLTLARERGMPNLRIDPEPVQHNSERIPDGAFKWAPELEEGGEADSDGEGEWVTAENIGRMATGGSGAKDDTVRLACATADFSVQNVLIQIGLPVLSVDGYRIHSVKHWAQICRGCGAFTRDSEKLFCPKCGNSTLDRVSYTLENGMPVVHDNRRKGPRLKGTIYSIPAPKGGRGEKLLLSEDEMLMGDRARQLRHEQKQFEKERRDNDPWNPDNVYDLTAKWNRPGRVHGSGYPRPTVGAGRKNPNVPTYKWKKK